MKRATLIALVTAVILAGAAVWYFALGGQSTTPSPDHSISASAQNGADATKALRTLTTAPESLIPDDQKGTVTIANAVPEGSKIQVSQKSWAPASVNSGTLVATLSSPNLDDATFLVSMMKESGKWVVVGTIPVTG